MNNKKGNNHAKNTEHEHFVQGHKRPEAEAYGFLPGERPAQFICHSPSVEFLLEARDEGEHATPYSGTAGPKQPISIG